jgi:carboxymethylenebutenolidase
VSDGTSMRAYVAHPETKPAAGMLVFQEAFGVNAHIRDVTERFAREGYLSISPELYHRGAGDGFDVPYSDLPAGLAQLRQLTDAGVEADIRAAYTWLQANAGTKPLPTGAVGYCMGGRVATLAAITLPVACGISYYGGGIAPSQNMNGLLDRLQDLQAPMMFFWGGLDHHIGSEKMQAVISAMKAANKPYANIEFSDADHGFFCDARPSYNPAAASQAWPLTLAFLKTNIAAQARVAAR